MNTIWRGCLTGFATLAAVAGYADAQVTAGQIEAGLGLLPVEARAGATILVQEGHGFAVHRAGTNGWQCRIWRPQDRLAANCHHRELSGKIEIERKLNAEGASGEAVREYLGEALRAGRVAIPRGSVEISGSGALPEGADVPAVMEGYYFVYFPFETAKTFGVPSSDPGGGRPWLHHGGTADAHLMWRRAHETGR